MRWINHGATIMVCGSALGMASALDDKLLAAMGQVKLDRLTEAGRYRRDIY